MNESWWHTSDNEYIGFMEEEIRKKLCQFYKGYYFYAFKKAILFTRNEETAKELCQEVFLKVINEIEKGNTKVFDKNYLIRTTTNCCIDFYRKYKTKKEELFEQLDKYNDKDLDLESQIFFHELILKLPPYLTEIAIYHLIDGFTLDEIVSITGIPKRTLQRRIEEIKKILATFF